MQLQNNITRKIILSQGWNAQMIANIKSIYFYTPLTIIRSPELNVCSYIVWAIYKDLNTIDFNLETFSSTKIISNSKSSTKSGIKKF